MVFVARVLHARPEHARRERGAQADAREMRHESSSGFVRSAMADSVTGSGLPAVARIGQGLRAKAGGSRGSRGSGRSATPAPAAFRRLGKAFGWGESANLDERRRALSLRAVSHQASIRTGNGQGRVSRSVSGAPTGRRNVTIVSATLLVSFLSRWM